MVCRLPPCSERNLLENSTSFVQNEVFFTSSLLRIEDSTSFWSERSPPCSEQNPLEDPTSFLLNRSFAPPQKPTDVETTSSLHVALPPANQSAEMATRSVLDRLVIALINLAYAEFNFLTLGTSHAVVIIHERRDDGRHICREHCYGWLPALARWHWRRSFFSAAPPSWVAAREFPRRAYLGHLTKEKAPPALRRSATKGFACSRRLPGAKVT